MFRSLTSFTLQSRESLHAALVWIPESLLGRSRYASLGNSKANSDSYMICERLDPLTAQLLGCCLETALQALPSGSDESSLARCASHIVSLLRDNAPAQSNSALASAPDCVTVIEDYIRAHVAEPLTLDDLIRVVGLSARTIQEAFRRHRGYSPMQFLRECRLSAAFDELSHPQGQTCVTSTALRWGFNHLGRFSTYFLRRFGKSPSTVLRLARAASH